MTANAPTNITEQLRNQKFRNLVDAVAKDLIIDKISQIHVIHDYYLQTRRLHPQKNVPSQFDSLDEKIGELIDILHQIVDLQENYGDISQMVDFNKLARIFGAGSNLSSIIEEFATGEDTLRDVLVNTIPFVLSRMGETAYVKSAREGFKPFFLKHTTYIYESFWKLAKQRQVSSTTYDKKESEEMGKYLKSLGMTLGDDTIDHNTRFLLHLLLYIVLYNSVLNSI